MTQEAKVVAGVIFATIAILAIILLSSGGKNANNSSSNKPADAGKVTRSDSAALGPESAKVTLVEFADFQCPYCAETYKTLKQIRKDYEGKVRFVYRNFPLPQHQNARITAQAAEAAGRQGKFWEMEDKLYTNQKEWESSSSVRDIISRYAKESGLDMAKFQTDLEDQSIKDKINRDVADGDALKVDSTPRIFLNDKVFEPPYTYDAFKKAIEEALK